LPTISQKIDDDCQAPDAQILETFSLNGEHNRLPKLPALLSKIANKDKRLKRLTAVEAGTLLGEELSVEMALGNAWREEAFKEVRQLGALLSTIWLILESS
jgi:hypothetical protein